MSPSAASGAPEQGAEALLPGLRLGAAQLTGPLPSVLCGCCPSHGWALADGYLLVDLDSPSPSWEWPRHGVQSSSWTGMSSP